MQKTHTIRIEAHPSNNKDSSYGARVIEHTASGDYSSFYSARNYDAARAMADGLALILGKNSFSNAQIEIIDALSQSTATASAP